ncbi:hypothetical protein TUM4438_29580 [Shewanella sairae]|uniref:Uncharacterized protein n=1 Tax=Shewanella sairae TaxID=190310 RepID=A0ABQ4PKE4_9GAMM|nr:hypothetical protein TUM4438_29580 [Shewanella sairae]
MPKALKKASLNTRNYKKVRPDNVIRRVSKKVEPKLVKLTLQVKITATLKIAPPALICHGDYSP